MSAIFGNKSGQRQRQMAAKQEAIARVSRQKANEDAMRSRQRAERLVSRGKRGARNLFAGSLNKTLKQILGG